MIKYIISIAYLLLSSTFALHAKTQSKIVDIQTLLDPQYENLSDIGHIQFPAPFSDKNNPEKVGTFEFYIGSSNETQSSDESLKLIKEMIEDDKKRFKTQSISHIIIGPNAQEFSKSKSFEKRLELLGMQNSPIKIETTPSFLNDKDQVGLVQKQLRFPSSDEKLTEKELKQIAREKRLNKWMGREFWTVFRFATSSGGAVYGFIHSAGLSFIKSFSIAMWAGFASGALTYYSNTFGDFLTNGKWSEWLIKSEDKAAKAMRKAFGINGYSLQDSMIRHQEYFKRKFPNVYEVNKELFAKDSLAKAKKDKIKIEKLLARLKHAEEYLKWYVTEVLFTGIALKAPQIWGGVAAFTGTAPLLNEVLIGSLAVTFAQGPGDIAIQVRKYQQVAELKENVLSGKVKVEAKQALLEEIDKVLASDGKYARYTINDGSHYKLKTIENKARFKASMFSAVSVTGIVFELAGIPGGSVLLGSAAVGGGVYLAKVKGFINPSKVTKASKKLWHKIQTGQFGFNLQGWKTRRCAGAYVLAL